MVNSPLIWAGGKSRAMSHVLDALPHGDCLVEPFVGSGSVFLNTDYKTYILCDSNATLINFHSILKSKTEGLLNAAAELLKEEIIKNHIISIEMNLMYSIVIYVHTLIIKSATTGCIILKSL